MTANFRCFRGVRGTAAFVPTRFFAVISVAAALILISMQGFVHLDARRALAAEGPKVIVVDPGHGGRDQGVTGPGGISEKTVMLALARELRDRLSPDFKVALTRSGDYSVDIKQRTSMANHYNAELFISLHSGGSPVNSVNVWTVYHEQPKTVSRDADKKQGPFLWDSLQQRHIPSSAELAQAISKRLQAGSAGQSAGVMGAMLPVLSGADMPAVVIEAGYLTHPVTAGKFEQDAYVSEVAVDIAKGIFDFFEK